MAQIAAHLYPLPLNSDLIPLNLAVAAVLAAWPLFQAVEDPTVRAAVLAVLRLVNGEVNSRMGIPGTHVWRGAVQRQIGFGDIDDPLLIGRHGQSPNRGRRNRANPYGVNPGPKRRRNSVAEAYG